MHGATASLTCWRRCWHGMQHTGAARAAGLPCVAVSFGFNDKPVHELGAEAVIDHFDALVPMLATL